MAVPENESIGFRQLLKKHPEWIVSLPDGSMFPIRAGEIAITEADGVVVIRIPTDIGMRDASPQSIRIIGDNVLLTYRNLYDDSIEEITLVPRLESAGVRLELDDARMFRSQEIASALQRLPEPLRSTRFEFSSDGGRMVTIFTEDKWKRQRLVMADVSDSLTPEYLLTSLLLKMDSLSRRGDGRMNPMTLVLTRKNAGIADELVKTLRPHLKDSIELLETHLADEDELELIPIKKGKSHPRRNININRPGDLFKTEIAETLITSIVDRFPENIDTIFTSAGWTLRFNGLPFLRLREVQGRLRSWLGVGERRGEIPISDLTDALQELLLSLSEYRRHDPPTRRHEYHRLAPEAWLEWLLIRDITRLDPNLIIAPVYNQFRSGSDRIDILALRSDGRTVIIEVKVSSDREVLFQTLDYWRKIESWRRRGASPFEELFPGESVRDEPPIIYIVAPLLSFHRDFEFLVGCVNPAIRICRFDLNEDWRRGISVHRRTEY